MNYKWFLIVSWLKKNQEKNKILWDVKNYDIPIQVHINKALLEHRQAHAFAYQACWLSWQRLRDPQNLKYCLSGPLQKKLANSGDKQLHSNI